MNGAPAEGKFRSCTLKNLPHHCEKNEIVVQGESGQLPGSSAHRAAKPAVIRLVELMLAHAQFPVGGFYITEQSSPSLRFIFINIINRRAHYYNKLSVNILNRRKCSKKFCCALSLPARVSARPDAGKRFSAVTRQANEDAARGRSDSTRSSVQTKYPPRCPPTCGRLCNIRTGGRPCTAGARCALMQYRAVRRDTSAVRRAPENAAGSEYRGQISPPP